MTTTMDGRGRPRRWATAWVLTATAAMLLTMLGAWSTPVRAEMSPAGGSTGHTLFADSFTHSPDPAWTFFNRSGQVTGGRLVIDGDYLPGTRPSRDGWAMTHVGDTSWRDYSFSMTYDSSNPSGSPSEAHMAAAYFRVMTSGARGLGTHYRLAVWDPGQPDPTGVRAVLNQGLIQLWRINKGDYTTLKTMYDSATVVGGNQLTVAVKGARITVTVNGERKFSIVDPHPIRAGGVGVGAIWETNASFDNVLVRCIHS